MSLHAAWLAEYYAPNHTFAQVVGADGRMVGRDLRCDVGSVGSDSLSLYRHRGKLRGLIGDRSPLAGVADAAGAALVGGVADVRPPAYRPTA